MEVCQAEQTTKYAAHFAAKTQDQVRKLIAGTNNAISAMTVSNSARDSGRGICRSGKGPDFSGINLLKPKEIKEFLDEYVIGRDDARRCYP